MNNGIALGSDLIAAILDEVEEEMIYRSLPASRRDELLFEKCFRAFKVVEETSGLSVLLASTVEGLMTAEHEQHVQTFLAVAANHRKKVNAPQKIF